MSFPTLTPSRLNSSVPRPKSANSCGLHDAEDVLELLNFHDQELSLKCLAEIQKQSALEEAEPKQKTVTVKMLTEGLGLTESGSEVSERVTGTSGEQQQLHREF